MRQMILKGNIIHTPTKDEFILHENSYIVVEEGVCQGIYETLPEFLLGNEIVDYEDAIIIPSFIDLHVHAPQFVQMGIGLNLPLIDWLYQYTFRIEERFADVNYARKVYPGFVEDLYNNGTLRSVIFGTIHNESNQVLVEEMIKKGISGFVGKVNMSRFAPVNLIETKEKSLKGTQKFCKIIKENYEKNGIYPIVTPRFAPSCSSELLGQLGEYAVSNQVPVQSHLSETRQEIEWVKELFEEQISEDVSTYSDIYRIHNLFGQSPTVMAHGIYMEPKEIQMAKETNVFIAHCPNSNMNLTSGIMPLANYIDDDVKVGLGSDIGAGHTLAMNNTITSAIQNAKLRNVLYGDCIVNEAEAYYLATMMNGEFITKSITSLGNKEIKIGCFMEGYSFDALIIKDDNPLMDTLTPIEQLQRFLYRGTPEHIKARYLEGLSI